MELQPEFPKALSLSGVVAYQQQAWKKALHYLQRAEKLYPPHSEQAETMRRGSRAAQAKLDASSGSVSDVLSARSDAVEETIQSMRAAVKLRVTAMLAPSIAVPPNTPVFVLSLIHI